MSAPEELQIIEGDAIAAVAQAIARRHPEPPQLPPLEDMPASLRFNAQAKAWLGARRGKPRSWGFHPSEMKKLCPALFYFVEQERNNLASADPETVRRAYAFLRDWIDGRAREFNPGVQMELREGDYIHDDVRAYLGVLGVLVGRWRCSFCDDIPASAEFAQMPRTEVPDLERRRSWDAAPCGVCSGRNLRNDIGWYYVEPYIKLAAWEIDGHVDGVLHVPFKGQMLKLILEIKSINEAGYLEKYGEIPKPEHIEQASLYAWAFGMSHVCFIYVNKGQVNQWKEFVVPRDEGSIRDAQGKILAVQEARARGEPPVTTRACKDVREPRAAACPAVERCFGCKPPENFFGRA